MSLGANKIPFFRKFGLKRNLLLHFFLPLCHAKSRGQNWTRDNVNELAQEAFAFPDYI